MDIYKIFPKKIKWKIRMWIFRKKKRRRYKQALKIRKEKEKEN